MKMRRVCLRTEKLAELRHFYGATLGLPLHEDGVDGFALNVGASELVFRGGVAAPYHFAINIPSPLFGAARDWLAERAPVLPLPTGGDTMHWRAWNAHACYFRDPAGNIGELIARHNLAEEGEAAQGSPFDPGADLRGISEIGLALAEVGAACRLIEKRLGLPVWDAGDGDRILRPRSDGTRFLRPRSDGTRFQAMGSERGLLICVKRGHAWFPTEDVLATPAPLQVTFAGAEERELRLPGTDYELAVVSASR